MLARLIQSTKMRRARGYSSWGVRYFSWLIMESGLVIDQDLNGGLEQSLPAFSGVVNKLEEPQIQREPFLGYATIGSKPCRENRSLLDRLGQQTDDPSHGSDGNQQVQEHHRHKDQLTTATQPPLESGPASLAATPRSQTNSLYRATQSRLSGTRGDEKNAPYPAISGAECKSRVGTGKNS